MESLYLTLLHYDTTVPHSNGTVYELDGLQPGPISVGTYTPISTSSSSDTVTDTDHPWLTVARTAIQTRIQKYSTSEIKFNLMALTQDKRTFLQSKIKSLKEDDETMGILNLQLMEEEELRKQWKDENERRRHNYLPFCMELIKALAKSGNLQGFTTKAKGNAAASRLRRMG
jgi:ubiquitin carboxyl-terminal hydrolase L5